MVRKVMLMAVLLCMLAQTARGLASDEESTYWGDAGFGSVAQRGSTGQFDILVSDISASGTVVKYQYADVNQSVTRSTATVPPTTGSTQLG